MAASRSTARLPLSEENRVMAHFVSHYPNREQSDAVAQALLDAGVGALEVQFPFSDPSADGPAIQQACQRALDAGFRVADGFSQVSRVAASANVPVYLMSYASIPFRIGTREFCRRAADAGVRGLIVPDLPVDVDEGLWEAADVAGVEVTPVVVSPAPEIRLRALEARGPKSVYVALRRGITGSRTELSEEALQLLTRIRALDPVAHGAARPGADTAEAAAGERAAGAADSSSDGTVAAAQRQRPAIMAGFGIEQPEQVKALMPYADWAVVGSAFVRAIAEQPGSPAEAVSMLARNLIGGSGA